MIRGAASKLDEVRAERDEDAQRRRLRERFLGRTRSGAGLDLDAALAVRERGWAGG